MPLIAITQYTQGKIVGIVMGCSQERYDLYMQTHEINEYTISASFLKDYLIKCGKSIKTVAELSKPVVADNKKEIFLWSYSNVVDAKDVKILFEELDLSYSQFIDSYAEHLKSL